MTWWEVEQMAGTVADLEKALEEWALSAPDMRREQQTLDTLTGKIQRRINQTESIEKKIFLEQLAERIEDLREHLTERLKRDVPNRS